MARSEPSAVIATPNGAPDAPGTADGNGNQFTDRNVGALRAASRGISIEYGMASPALSKTRTSPRSLRWLAA
ncbi:hypothetical protein GGD41_006942 [Paraburkholderia bryophila]|uniref:Uncharacterized protein n=1 Tax=Paraburkholderia bryophila TaxID=420952 RepID=A0A7Z0B3D3_9BURK|nr:hypothetical protein [Paraburkholderia bryophila]